MDDYTFESFIDIGLTISDGLFTNTVDTNGEEPSVEGCFEQKPRGFYFRSMTTTVETQHNLRTLKTAEFQKRVSFNINKNTWLNQTGFLANNDFDNDYFNEIISMGEDAIPLIKEELKKGPSLLVYALDKIRPNTVICEGYVPLKPLCDLWLDILTENVNI